MVYLDDAIGLLPMSLSFAVWKWRCRAWRYRLQLEPEEIRFVREQLSPGDAAIDIGAHKGGFTYWMCKQVGRQGKVFAFEPHPVLAQGLKSLIACSRFSQTVVVEDMGLSSDRGVLTLHVPGSKDTKTSSFEASANRGTQTRQHPVHVTTLDDYFSDYSEHAIRLIKCDVEGHELEVLQGGEEVFMTHRPRLILECVTHCRKSRSVDEVFSFLADLRYGGYFLLRGRKYDIDRFNPSVHQADASSPDCVNNFYFSAVENQKTSL